MPRNLEKEFESLLKAVKLSEKQFKFFKNLVNPQSETCGNIINSFHAAGYENNLTSKYYAYKVYNGRKFQKVLTAYREKELKKEINREFTIKERVTEHLFFIIDRSKQGGDLSTMRQAVMDLAKLNGLLVDRQHISMDPVTEAAIDKTKRIEAAAIAETRLIESPGEPPDNIIDAVFESPLDAKMSDQVSNDEVETAILAHNQG